MKHREIICQCSMGILLYRQPINRRYPSRLPSPLGKCSRPKANLLLVACQRMSGLLEMKKFNRGLSHGFLVYLTTVLEILLQWLRINHVV